MNFKRQHQYRLSYTNEVGSSFDPDMEDVTEWEDELRGMDMVMALPLSNP